MISNKIQNIVDITTFASTCRQCELYKGRVKPVFARGHIDSHIMICGMCPGPDENQAGLPFVGLAGQVLDALIKDVFGSTSVYITNLVKCFVQPGNKLKEEWINACLPYFIAQVGLIKPTVIISLGKDVGNFFTNSVESIGSIRGQVLSYMGAKTILTYHPSYLARGGGVNHPEYKTVITDFKKALSFL